jgi:Ran-binding protein 1
MSIHDLTEFLQAELPTVKKVTGEEKEECIFRMRTKLYRIRDEQWKERGTGNAKLLRNKETKKIRFVMRQEKTLKPVANFILQESPLCELVPMKNNDKAFLWSCNDFSDGEATLEKLCARFQNVENTNLFKEAFEAARKFNDDVRAGKADSELVFAPAIEDQEEVVADDPDKNKTADAEGGAEEGEGDE